MNRGDAGNEEAINSRLKWPAGRQGAHSKLIQTADDVRAGKRVSMLVFSSFSVTMPRRGAELAATDRSLDLSRSKSNGFSTTKHILIEHQLHSPFMRLPNNWGKPIPLFVRTLRTTDAMSTHQSMSIPSLLWHRSDPIPDLLRLRTSDPIPDLLQLRTLDSILLIKKHLGMVAVTIPTIRASYLKTIAPNVPTPMAVDLPSPLTKPMLTSPHNFVTTVQAKCTTPFPLVLSLAHARTNPCPDVASCPILPHHRLPPR